MQKFQGTKVPGPFRSGERKFQGARRPRSERAWERMGQGTKVPGSELARVLLADSLPVANWPGSEKAVNQLNRAAGAPEQLANFYLNSSNN